jgi:hypothetical protein
MSEYRSEIKGRTSPKSSRKIRTIDVRPNLIDLMEDPTLRKLSESSHYKDETKRRILSALNSENIERKKAEKKAKIKFIANSLGKALELPSNIQDIINEKNRDLKLKLTELNNLRDYVELNRRSGIDSSDLDEIESLQNKVDLLESEINLYTTKQKISEGLNKNETFLKYISRARELFKKIKAKNMISHIYYFDDNVIAENVALLLAIRAFVRYPKTEQDVYLGKIIKRTINI